MSQGSALDKAIPPAETMTTPAASSYGVLIAVSLGSLLAPLNSTMIAVALPVIRKDFDISHAAAGWLISSYLIAMAVVQPAGGRLGDQIGRVTVFRAGLVAFLVCSIAAAIAPNFALLLTFRTAQAVSGAVLIPNGIALLRATVPLKQFGKFSGLNSSVVGATAAAGPVLGGAILVFGAWRWLFVANIPVVILGLVLAARLKSPPRAASAALSGTSTRTARIDWIGLALFAGLLGLVTVLLNELRSEVGTNTIAVAAILAAVLVAFIWRQKRTSAPTAEWRLFRIRSFVGASTHILLMNLAMYTTLLAVPFFLTDVQHKSSTVAGLLLGCMAALQALVAPFAGSAADAKGRRTPTIVSSVIALVATLLLVLGISRDVSFAYLAVAVTILGLGVGIGFVSASTAAVEAAPQALAGSAAGTQSMMRYFGSIIGAGALSGLLSGEAPSIAIFRLVFVLVAAMVGISIVAAAMVDRAPVRE
jgi:EmrB/QacA subfamily drug resistance transporter